MNKDIVHSGQSFLNKVVECTGDVDNAFEMMLLNGLQIMDVLPVGSILKKSEVTDWDVVDYFTENNRPATTKNININLDSTLIFEFPGEFPFSF